MADWNMLALREMGIEPHEETAAADEMERRRWWWQWTDLDWQQQKYRQFCAGWLRVLCERHLNG